MIKVVTIGLLENRFLVLMIVRYVDFRALFAYIELDTTSFVLMNGLSASSSALLRAKITINGLTVLTSSLLSGKNIQLSRLCLVNVGSEELRVETKKQVC